jgi:tagatose 1,6-diphosphate aldolase
VSNVLAYGKLLRLRRCSTTSGHLVIAAVDHRQGLRKILDPAAPAAVAATRLVEFKRDVVASVQGAASAVLIDPEYGLPAAAAGTRTGVVVALEATGYGGSPVARESALLPGWSVEKAARLGADAVKLLVYYHPEAPNAAEHEALVADVAAECDRYELPLVLEPLVYGLDPGVPAADKRALVVETAGRLTAAGADILKAQLPGDANGSYEEWLEGCRALTAASRVPWVLLSEGVGFDTFCDQTNAACAAGASGVAVGRAGWGEALAGAAARDFLDGEGRRRLAALRAIVEEHGTPWEDAVTVPAFDEGWFASY